ncbi:MAG TPA: enoyl-CoA hydratase-related protein [Bosea sp. (in: a-proteobacteria)]|jgi:enoyl-CoA hydratase/carnithine racemase|uniref:enoyl-CoA hydratase/isomerase family protein n=1 Tax=Bosea sp. (in: a-proteobacteria) TaxID=1871050 RepID=UPI002E14B81F|nr:enoyl-CoA hydratase-related protein [Bosea sp. (in: a-proteobacteria)]
MSDIELERRGAVAIVAINRPAKRNALNGLAWKDLGDSFVRLREDETVRAIVLTGRGGAFCAGDDIGAFASLRDDPAARQVYWNSIMAAYAAVSASQVPVVAAVSGPCVGGGCTLALRCDFRIADATARFGVPPAKLGLVYPADSTQLLVATAGANTARRMLYTGELIDAQAALSCGLVSELVTGDPVAAALRFVEPMTANAPLSILASKIACDASVSGRSAVVAAEVAALSDKADRSEDYREGARAFAEKRKPVFTGR